MEQPIYSPRNAHLAALQTLALLLTAKSNAYGSKSEILGRACKTMYDLQGYALANEKPAILGAKKIFNFGGNMQIFRYLTLLSLVVGSASAQDYPNAPHQTTSAIPNSRYEIVQSPVAARWTFRLDRYSGSVWQLVTAKDGGLVWEGMLVAQAITVSAPTKPRFQIFTSGIAARHTFLLDAESGKTWQLTLQKFKPLNSEEETDINVWEPFRH